MSGSRQGPIGRHKLGLGLACGALLVGSSIDVSYRSSAEGSGRIVYGIDGSLRGRVTWRLALYEVKVSVCLLKTLYKA